VAAQRVDSPVVLRSVDLVKSSLVSQSVSQSVSWLVTYRSSGGQSPAYHRGGRGSSPGPVTWDLWWT
jgi:hypothetical protein